MKFDDKARRRRLTTKEKARLAEALSGNAFSFSGAGLSQAAIAKIVDETQRIGGLSRENFNAQHRRTAKILKNLWGDQAEANVEAALKVIDRCEETHPGVWKMMEVTMAIYSQRLIRLLKASEER